MVEYIRRITANFEASSSTLLRFLQEEPTAYLDLINVHVEEELSRNAEAGEWKVMEKLTIPFVPETRFKTRFDRLKDGCRWQSWVDNGIYVESTLIINHSKDKINKMDDTDEDKRVEKATCSATEMATLQCPFYLYPIVRHIFVKNHNANIVKLQNHIKSKEPSSAPS